ncbi:MAG: DUF411 domain-containing protein [Anaerolineae bacterium]|nr:DUF411 domain-containing protein [Gemmatimonadaceae bacterium]
MSLRRIPFVIAALALTSASGMALAHSVEHMDPIAITVYKSPTCGCCANWVDHLRKHGFRVTVKDTIDLDPIKQKLGVPDRLASCHTGVVRGYVVEGHAPADDIKKMLKERPKVVGIAVPGMPMGSPGMEGPRSDSYEVLAFDKQGKTKVFARH